MNKLQFEAEAAKALIENLKGFDDDDLAADMVEGETGFMEALDKALEYMAAQESIVIGAKAMSEQMLSRANAAQIRINNTKTAIELAMLTTGFRETLQRPTATVSLAKRPPALAAFDDSDVPTQFYKQQPPKLDRKALLDAVKSGERIDGIELLPERHTITIRRK